jgi:hypothetical protein
MFVNTMMGGQSVGAPDVCKTPTPPVGQPVPIPYPNTATGATTNPATAAPTVLVVGMPSITQISKGTVSNGDEAGVYQGVASNQIMGPNSYILGSLTVLTEGAPVQKLTSITGQNGLAMNAPGVSVAPSQTSVLVLS